MKTKHRKWIPKTRSHKVEKSNVSIRKHTISRINEKWKEDITQEYCKDSERQGDENSDHGTEWKDTEKYSQIDSSGDAKDSKESVHPGLVQTLPGLSEPAKEDADDETSAQTCIEAEELL